MQIVRAARQTFAAADKSKGTPEEYRAAALDSNAHYGSLRVVDREPYTRIERASFPNWDGRETKSTFTLTHDERTYTVAKPSSGAAEGAHGEVTWQRVRP
jgi:hypothetical protein